MEVTIFGKFSLSVEAPKSIMHHQQGGIWNQNYSPGGTITISAPPPGPRLIMIFRFLIMSRLIFKNSTVKFLGRGGVYGPKFKMAATRVGGRANFFPITPILVLLVSKV